MPTPTVPTPSPRAPRSHALALACAATLLCAATGPGAQTPIYKQVDATGQVSFSDLVQPTPEPTPAPPRRTRYGSMTLQQAGEVDASEAARRLNQAQRERLEGAQPMRAEQRDTGGGNVNHAYWRRQEKLRQNVEQAQRRANDVQRPAPTRAP